MPNDINHFEYVVKGVAVTSPKYSTEVLSSGLASTGFKAEDPGKPTDQMCLAAVPKTTELIVLSCDTQHATWFKLERLRNDNTRIQICAGRIHEHKAVNGSFVFTGTTDQRSWTVTCYTKLFSGKMPEREIPRKAEKPRKYTPPPTPNPAVRHIPTPAPVAVSTPKQMAAEVTPSSSFVTDLVKSKESTPVQRALVPQREHKVVKVADVMLFEGQPRKEFDPADILGLGAGIEAEGQLQPCLVRPASAGSGYLYELIDGERRLRAAIGKGLLEIEVIVDHRPMTPHQHFLLAFVANFNRRDHSLLETMYALKRLRDGGESFDSLVKRTNLSESWLRRIHALSQLHPELQALLGAPTPRSEQLRMLDAEMLLGRPVEEQIVIYRRALGKAKNRKQLSAFIAREVDTVNRVQATAKVKRSRSISLTRFIERADAEVVRFLADAKIIAEYLNDTQTPQYVEHTLTILRDNARHMEELANKIDEQLSVCRKEKTRLVPFHSLQNQNSNPDSKEPVGI